MRTLWRDVFFYLNKSRKLKDLAAKEKSSVVIQQLSKNNNIYNSGSWKKKQEQLYSTFSG